MIFAFYFTFLCHVCPNYPHTGLTTATTPSGHQMAIVVSRTVYSIHISLYDTFLTQNILYQIKRDGATYERDLDAPSVISKPGGK